MTVLGIIARRGGALSTSLQRTVAAVPFRRIDPRNLAIRNKSAAAPSPSTASSATKNTNTHAADPSFAREIAKAIAAGTAAITTVSLVASAVDEATASSIPTFDPQVQRFDQSYFAGRFCRMLLACDPYLLLFSEEDARRSAALVDEYQTFQDGSRKKNKELWEARRISEAALHPDTGDCIPRPFRMSGYVPFNGPICVAMVVSQSTLPLLFAAWANQSQNALVNYYNRNAKSTMTNETLAKSYAAAVGSAMLVAFGLATLIQKKYPAQKAKEMLRWVAFPSSVIASALNCYIVRSPEIDSGIQLVDSKGQDVLEGETSQEAARRGVVNTTASRAILQAPVYFLPPVLLATFGPLKAFLAKNPALVMPVSTFLILTSFGLGLPATVAMFPQISEIKASEAEQKFQHLRDPQTNKPYDVFYYNKGL